MPGQSGPGSNGNEGVLRVPQNSSIAGTPPSDCLVSYPGDSLGGGVLPLRKEAVGVFYSPSRLGNLGFDEFMFNLFTWCQPKTIQMILYLSVVRHCLHIRYSYLFIKQVCLLLVMRSGSFIIMLNAIISRSTKKTNLLSNQENKPAQQPRKQTCSATKKTNLLSNQENKPAQQPRGGLHLKKIMSSVWWDI